MDPLLAANLKAAAASQTKRRAVTPGPLAGRSFERKKLVEQERMRGELTFMQRMEADACSKRAYSQVCALRQNPANARCLDKALDRLKPAKPSSGPVIVTHQPKLMYEGQDQQQFWAPLEYY
eukprot:TRINITY_DN5383_c0_g1_i2.p2 TRINITY_DN5383_c0_g1~~TRINITY_DN5383_c0_g1_i2.p2  ORF type:complete len:122 (+),score=32.25 TRINITY_DN5383_c0_g1_i2:80-445(+)